MTDFDWCQDNWVEEWRDEEDRLYLEYRHRFEPDYQLPWGDPPPRPTDPEEAR